MHRLLSIILQSYLVVFLLASCFTTPAHASIRENVSAQVGLYYLNLSGFVSPYASVVLSSDGIFLRSTVADAGGNFYFSQVLINVGFSHFCLAAVDFKKIGDSYTCINIPPATGSVTKKNIFLPPTLGISKSSALAGEEVFAFGYTMPYASVTLHLGPGLDKTVLADGTGYYIFTLKNLPVGKYELYSTAIYNNLNSLSPSKTVEFRSLSLWEKIIQFLRELWAKIITFFTSMGLGILWLAIPILILILILLMKLWPERFTSLRDRGIQIIGERKPKTHLHHFWLFHE